MRRYCGESGEILEERRGAKRDSSGQLLPVCIQAEYIRLSPSEAWQIMEEQSHVLLDVRRLDEFEAGHIEGAVLIPYDEISDRASAELPDKNAVILIYCRTGRRSQIAARELIGLGYTRVYDFGGMQNFVDYLVAGGAS
jgi:rhodanese-related sulfurtransferase